MSSSVHSCHLQLAHVHSCHSCTLMSSRRSLQHVPELSADFNVSLGFNGNLNRSHLSAPPPALMPGGWVTYVMSPDHEVVTAILSLSYENHTLHKVNFARMQVASPPQLRSRLPRNTQIFSNGACVATALKYPPPPPHPHLPQLPHTSPDRRWTQLRGGVACAAQ